MTVKKEFIKREVAGDILLLPAGMTALDLNGMLTLNEVGEFLWDRLPDAEDEQALVDAVLTEYEADRERVCADVHEFLEKLRALDII